MKLLTTVTALAVGALLTTTGLFPTSTNAAELVQAEPVTVTVTEGDTVSAMALAYYDSYDTWNTLATVNGIYNPYELMIGREVTVPRAVRVEDGDTLAEITMMYGAEGVLWNDIATLNGVDNPRTLQVGQVLLLTDNPDVNMGFADWVDQTTAVESYNNETEIEVDEESADYFTE